MRCKTIGAVVSLAMAITAITACGGSDESGSSSSGPAKGTITLWARDTQKAFMGPLADAYNKSHKAQVKVSIIPSAQFVQKFGTAASSGDAPDVASIDLVFLPYFASQGALADISSLAEKLPYKDDLSPAHSKLADWEGKTYALPFTAEASVLFYNKKLFKRAGLDPDKPPSNYAEMIEAAKKVRALGPKSVSYTHLTLPTTPYV